ncbi:MAG: hypothetical protein CL840_08730 [Crocinitomicaceae bacterium]|nr:hypothetical protein [Crocinitomicaceae bacterium]
MSGNFAALIVRRFILFSFFLFGCVGPSDAKWTQEDSTRIFKQLSVAFSYAYSEPDTAKTLCSIALKDARKTNYPYGKLKALNVAGILEDITGNNDSALSLYFKARKIAIEINDSLSQAQIGNNIGLIYWNQEKLDSALIWYRNSEAYFRRVKNTQSLANAINNIALIYDDKDSPDKSIVLHIEALRLRQEIDNTYGIGASMHNISMAYTFLNAPDSAIYWGKKAIPYRLKVKDNYGLSKTYHNLAIIYDRIDEVDSSIAYSLKSIDIKKKIDDMYGLASAYNNLGLVYFNNKEISKAKSCIENGLEIAQTGEYIRILNELYGNAALIADFEKNYKLASSLKDSLEKYNKHAYEKETNEKLQKLQVEFEVERKEAKIERLNQENEIKKRDLERRNIQIQSLVVISVLVILLGLLLFFSIRKRQELKHNKALLNERQKGSEAVIQATEEERKQIAKDLHDGIGQQLAAVKLSWENTINKWKKGDRPVKEEYEKMGKLIDETSSDVRSISHRMMPRVLQEKGMISAIEEMLNLSLDPDKITYRFEHFQIDRRLSPRLEVSIYRIIQELIKNIITHSNASEVHIQLMQVKKQLILVVEDNGVGIDPKNNKSDGIGLLSLKGRVDSFQGQINFEPSPNSGTLVTVRIPLG